ncbi:unnamed protein product [Sympodiomycopsis kandeliae]
MTESGTASAASVHLVVCCHGLWGEPVHLSYVAKTLAKRWDGEISPRSATETDKDKRDKKGSDSVQGQAKAPNGSGPGLNSNPTPHGTSIVVLNTASNAGLQTYDGIDWCAERVIAEIHKEIHRLGQSDRKVVSFSILGYSLGGLIARYTVGLLHSRNFFDNVEPVNFTTFATPHIGVSNARGLFSQFAAAVGSRSLGRTGVQLYGRDKGWHDDTESNSKHGSKTKTSLLEAMSKPESAFLRGLRLFKNVDFYANATSDWVVPIRSGALMEVDPWIGWPEGGELDLAGNGVQMDFLPGYPALVTAVRIPDTPPPKKSLPLRIYKAVVPQKWPWLLNPYRVPWRFPLNWIGVIFSPVVIPLFFVLVIFRLQSGSRGSKRRVKDLERDWLKGRGELTTDELIYGEEHERDRVSDVIHGTVQGVVEDNVDLSATSTTQLPTSPSQKVNGFSNGKIEPSIKKSPRSATTPLALEVTPESRRYLAKKEMPLTDVQKKIQENLNSLPGLRKHLVFFDNVMNSHAIIVCRTPSIEVHRRGQIVVKHYVDNFQL